MDNPEAELVRRKGMEHEAAELARYRAAGLSVAEIELEPDFDRERAVLAAEEVGLRVE